MAQLRGEIVDTFWSALKCPCKSAFMPNLVLFNRLM